MAEDASRIEVRELTRKEIPSLTSLGRHRLGLDYVATSDFLEALAEDDRFCMVAFDGKLPVGFALCREFGPEDEPEEMALPESPELDDLLGRGRIGLVRLVAVAPDSAGRGAASAMVAACLERMAEDGCGVAASMARVTPEGKEELRRALSSNGFGRTALSVPGYLNLWVDSEDGHFCPQCGQPCRCSAVLWTRPVGGSDPPSER